MTESVQREPLRILFLYESVMNNETEAKRIELISAKGPTPIQTELSSTRESTVEAATKTVLTGNYDAVVVEDTHIFTGHNEAPRMRAIAYEAMGLNQPEESWMETDPNYGLSGVALLRFMKAAMVRVKPQKTPKLGYIDTFQRITFEKRCETLGVSPDIADFHISTGYENSVEHVQNIYDAFDIQYDTKTLG